MPVRHGPDDHPSRPSWTPPPGACDSHVHVFGPFDRFPLDPARTFTPPEVPFERLRSLHDFLGIERSILVQSACHGSDNSVTIDAIARSGGRYRGVAIVGPELTDAELTRLHDGGMRGVRFHFIAHLGHGPDMDFFWRTLDRIEPMGWHAQLHFDAGSIPQLVPVFERIRIPFVIDHMGRVSAKEGIEQPAFKTLTSLLATNPLAWVKVSGSDRLSTQGLPFRDAIPFSRALYAAAPERTVWGTDFPHPNLHGDIPNDGGLVDLLAQAFPDPADRQRILVDNPTRLYWRD